MHYRYRACSSNGRAMDWLHGQRWICALPIIVFWSFHSPRSSRGVLFPLDSILLYAQPEACGLLGRWNWPGYDDECIVFVRTPHAGLSLRPHFVLFFAGGVQQWVSLSVSLGMFYLGCGVTFSTRHEGCLCRSCTCPHLIPCLSYTRLLCPHVRCSRVEPSYFNLTKMHPM